MAQSKCLESFGTAAQFCPLGVWKFLEFLQERLYHKHEVACNNKKKKKKLRTLASSVISVKQTIVKKKCNNSKVSQRNLLNVVLVVSGYNYCCNKEAQLNKMTSNSVFNFILFLFSYRFNTLQKPQEGFIILRWRENIKHTNLMNDSIYFKILCALLHDEADVHLSSCLSILSNRHCRL